MLTFIKTLAYNGYYFYAVHSCGGFDNILQSMRSATKEQRLQRIN